MLAPVDIELWITGYLRSKIANVSVDNKEPKNYSATKNKPLIVVRSDGGSKTTWVSFDCSLGVSVLAGTRQDGKKAADLANQAYAILTDDRIIFAEGSPVASIEWTGCSTPLTVNDPQDVSRKYFTIQYTLVGDIT